MLALSWDVLAGNGTFNYSSGGCRNLDKHSCECEGKYPTASYSCETQRLPCHHYTSQASCQSALPEARCLWAESTTTCQGNTCVFPQVTAFTNSENSNLKLNAPVLPMPPSLLHAVMTSALESGKDSLNAGLQRNGLCLPPTFGAYVNPPPLVNMYRLRRMIWLLACLSMGICAVFTTVDSFVFIG